MFCDFVAPMVSVHQYEKYRFSYHWCYNQHMQRSCYSHAWLPKGRFFSTDERQATICNTWVQLSTHFSSWTLSPLFSQESSLLHFGVFLVVSHVFSTQKQSSKLNAPRSWRSRVFHFGTWKTLVGWRGHPRSAKLKTCRITRSCRLGSFDIESFRLAAFFVPGNLRCLAVSPEKWWCFCGQKEVAHQTYQTHQTRLFAGHCGQDFWASWQLQLLRSETARVGCKTVSWSQITGLHMQFFDVEVIALIFKNRKVRKGCKGCVKLMYNFWKQSLKQLVIRHQAVVSNQ